MSFQEKIHVLLQMKNSLDSYLFSNALQGTHLDCTVHEMKSTKQVEGFIRTLSAPGNPNKLDVAILDFESSRDDLLKVLWSLRENKKTSQANVIILTGAKDPDSEQLAEDFSPLFYFLRPSTLADFSRLAFIVRAVSTRPLGNKAY